MPKGLIVTVQGGIAPVDYTDLGSYQRVVRGLIQPVDCRLTFTPAGAPARNLTEIPGFTIYCNEEGKIYNLPANEFATQIADECDMLMPDDFIAGDVAIVGLPDDIDGSTQDLTELQIAVLMERWTVTHGLY